MKHLFIVNPISGKADAGLYSVPRFIEIAARHKLDYQIEVTEYPNHACAIAKQAVAQHEEIRVYACGGDGTLNEVLHGVWSASNPAAQVGAIPCGSGNDFIRNFGTQQEFADIEQAVHAKPITVDLIKTDDGIAASICSVGLDADIAYQIPKFRRLPFCGGSTAYHLAILDRLSHRLHQRLLIEMDHTRLEDDFVIATVCNGSFYGSGFHAAPQAALQDGLLDVVLVKKMSKFHLASLLSAYKKGKHIQNGGVTPLYQGMVQIYRTKHVTVRKVNGEPTILNRDGECKTGAFLKTSILPSAIRFALPKEVYQRYLMQKSRIQ